jgi:hypothetical protein
MTGVTIERDYCHPVQSGGRTTELERQRVEMQIVFLALRFSLRYN